MWQDDKVVDVRRSLTERMIDDWEYESRRREAKMEKDIDDAIDGFFDGVSDFISSIFGGSRRR